MIIRQDKHTYAHKEYATSDQSILFYGIQPEINDAQFRTHTNFALIITTSASREVKVQSYRKASLSTPSCDLLKQH